MMQQSKARSFIGKKIQKLFILCLLVLGLSLSLASGGSPDEDAAPSSAREQDTALDCSAYLLDGGGYSVDAPSECGFDGVGNGYVDTACTPLVSQYCGYAGECQDSPSCMAVRYMEMSGDYAQCENIAADPGEFVVCIDIQLCEALVQKTCGVSPEAVTDETVCRENPACQQALSYYEQMRGVDGGSYATAQFCGQALQEPSVFPACEE